MALTSASTAASDFNTLSTLNLAAQSATDAAKSYAEAASINKTSQLLTNGLSQLSSQTKINEGVAGAYAAIGDVVKNFGDKQSR